MTERILIIDDEAPIAGTVRSVLQSQGYQVEIAATGAEGLRWAGRIAFDVVLLDLGLPDADGKELIPQLLKLNALSIIVLSARHQEGEKVACLDAGAEDYMDKPFGMKELLARIRAATRRFKRDRAAVTSFRHGDLVIDLALRSVTLQNVAIKLSPKEFDILEELARNAGKVVTHRQLLIAGWSDPRTDGQYLRSYIGTLRQKLEEDPTEPALIVTEPGVGYRLADYSEI